MGRTGVRGWVVGDAHSFLGLVGPRECDCSKDPCCDNGVPARGADGVEERVRAGRVSGGLTWVLGLTGLVWLTCSP